MSNQTSYKLPLTGDEVKESLKKVPGLEATTINLNNELQSLKNTVEDTTIPTKLSDLENDMKVVTEEELEDVEAIAKGRATGYVFDTIADMQTWLNDANNTSKLNLGDNLYIRAVDVPDYWWDGNQAQELETQKVELSEYATKEEVEHMKNVQGDWNQYDNSQPDYVKNRTHYLKYDEIWRQENINCSKGKTYESPYYRYSIRPETTYAEIGGVVIGGVSVPVTEVSFVEGKKYIIEHDWAKCELVFGDGNYNDYRTYDNGDKIWITINKTEDEAMWLIDFTYSRRSNNFETSVCTLKIHELIAVPIDKEFMPPDFVAEVEGKEDKSNKVTVLTGEVTDEQYPSAKAVKEYVAGELENKSEDLSEQINTLREELSGTNELLYDINELRYDIMDEKTTVVFSSDVGYGEGQGWNGSYYYQYRKLTNHIPLTNITFIKGKKYLYEGFSGRYVFEFIFGDGYYNGNKTYANDVTGSLEIYKSKDEQSWNVKFQCNGGRNGFDWEVLTSDKTSKIYEFEPISLNKDYLPPDFVKTVEIKEDVANKVTVLSSDNTDEQYPTAKATYITTHHIEEMVVAVAQGTADAISRTNKLTTDVDALKTQKAETDIKIGEVEERVAGKLDKGTYTETPYMGTNMLPIADLAGNTYSDKGITITVDENGVFTINGTSTSSKSFEITPNGEQYGLVKAGVTYKVWFKQLSGSCTNGVTFLFINSYNGLGSNIPLKDVANISTGLKTVNLTADTPLTRFAINIGQAGATFDNVKCIPYLVPADEYDKNYVGGTKKFDVSNLDKSYEINKVIGDVSPTYFNIETERVISEVLTSNLESDLSFLTFTDSHSFDDGKYRKYNDIMKSGGIDFMIGLGDYMPYDNSHTRATAIKSMTKALSIAGRDKNCYYAVGNHDAVFVTGNDPSADKTLTKKEQHKLMCSHLNSSVHFNELDPYGCYYYVDYESAKIRVIVLNTSDLYTDDGSIVKSSTMGSTLMMSQKQLTWFTEKALSFTDKSTPSDWAVLVCGHVYYPFGAYNAIPTILNAFKTGASLTQSWNDGDVTLSVDVDYSTQGAVDVIGFIYGHAHRDTTGTSEGIKIIQFRCDNARLDEVYIAEVDGVTAGSYYLTTVNGNKHGFTLSSDYPNAKYVMYNNYLSSSYTEASLLDENGVSVYNFSPKVSAYVDTMTEIATGFTAMREEGTATTESCAVVNVNKDTRTITVVPYGVGQPRVISY